MNKKRYIFLFNNVNIIIFIYRNKDKNKQFIKKNLIIIIIAKFALFIKSLIKNLNIFLIKY